MKLLEMLRTRRIYGDGAMGTQLQENGLKPGELPETWNVKHPEILVRIHQSYLEAGANIITTNTFGANALKYPEGAEYGSEELIRAAVRNAAKAREEYAGEYRKRNHAEPEPSFIGLDIGPTGKLLKPLGDLDFEDAVRIFGDIARIGAEEKADFIYIETMSDTYEVKACLCGIRENTDLPIFATMTFDEKGKLLTGADVPAAVALLEGFRVDALGLNCGLGPKQMEHSAELLLQYSSTPVIIAPNAGMPKNVAGKTLYELDPDTFAQQMLPIAEKGACILGGCCGTTPEHIRKMRKICENVPFLFPEDKNLTVVSSYGKACLIGDQPVLIGERINPTGKKKMKEALKENHPEVLLQEAVAQQENGADILDVNVGLPGIDETAVMRTTVAQIQTVTDLPLQLDTTRPEAMEAALRIYNGKALVNSVNGKEESMNAIFPMVRKYGGVVIALPLDEKGIPDTADGRLAVAQKIIDRAAFFGIPKKDLLIDGLVMTVSAVSGAAMTTLETVGKIRSKLGCKSVLGVSNVSFGLPQREIITSSFFTMALYKGLDAAIVNPCSEAVMRAYRSYLVLSGKDVRCAAYVSIYGGTEGTSLGKTVRKEDQMKETGSSGPEHDLRDAIIKGLRESAAHLAAEEMKEKDPLEIINKELIPALNRTGSDFEKGKAFLPQLLMSAEAAKEAFDILRTKIESKGTEGARKDKIVLATVKGDIHDIGKNIVKVLLQSYNYDVIDLGKDVAPETVLEAVLKDHVRMVGLSALMTTTVPSMEATIALLHKEAPFTRIDVGGAVMTQEVAEEIHADAYSRDAMAAVEYAEGLFGKKGQ